MLGAWGQPGRTSQTSVCNKGVSAMCLYHMCMCRLRCVCERERWGSGTEAVFEESSFVVFLGPEFWCFVFCPSIFPLVHVHLSVAALHLNIPTMLCSECEVFLST